MQKLKQWEISSYSFLVFKNFNFSKKDLSFFLIKIITYKFRRLAKKFYFSTYIATQWKKNKLYSNHKRVKNVKWKTNDLKKESKWFEQLKHLAAAAAAAAVLFQFPISYPIHLKKKEKQKSSLNCLTTETSIFYSWNLNSLITAKINRNCNLMCSKQKVFYYVCQKKKKNWQQLNDF